VPYVEIPVSYLLVNTSWTPTIGSYSSGNNFTNYPACVHSHGSGDYVYNFPGFTTIAQWQPFNVLSVIPFGSTINTVHFLTWYDAAAVGINLNTQYNPPFGPASGFVPSTGGPQLIDLNLAGQSFNRFDLANSVLQVAVANNISAAVHCDYVALAIDYTPPPDAFVMVWTAGAYPSGCGKPPLKRFKPFKMFDSAAGLSQAVTAQYMLTYGKPPPGYVIWCYWRTVSYDLIPRESSPITTFTITPWPPPG
jgi:hypothetical protein